MSRFQETICPYEELHIYYLQGLPPRNLLPADPAFLGCWEEEDFAFLFFSRPSLEIVEALVSGLHGVTLVDSYRMTYEEWQGPEALAPIEVGPFVVSPYWVDAHAAPGRIVLRMDPGVVFGTGVHPTTRDSLEALVHIWHQDRPQRVLDLGCGTGVLALAAARLGGLADDMSVLAVDVNPLCVETARKNVGLNRLEDRVRVAQGRAEEIIDTPADVLAANLPYDVLRILVERSGFYEKRWMILSGLMRSQVAAVLGVLDSRRVQAIRCWDEDPVWRTLLLRTREEPSGSSHQTP